MRTIAFIISYFLRLFPERALGRLGDGIGWFLFEVVRFRRQIVLENLKIAFEESYSESERLKIARANYQHYARTILEVLRSVSWDAKKYRENVNVHGWELLDQAVKAGTGCFVLTLHLGNWEYAIQTPAAHGAPVDIVVKRARHRGAERFLQWYRRKTGAVIHLESGTATDILKALSKGRLVGFIMDQFMGPPIGLPVRFFGKMAGTTVSLALLMEKKEVPLILAYAYRDKLGKTHVVYEAPPPLPQTPKDRVERLYAKTQYYNDLIERLIRRHPEQWLWIHRRWKTYNGEPRWTLKSSLSFAVLALFLFFGGCVSTPPTPTGIPLPPEPVVEAPRFTEPPQSVEHAAKPSIVDVIPEQTDKGTGVTKPAQKKNKKPSSNAATSPNNLPQKREEPAIFENLPAERIPFEIGERMALDLNWMALPAGTATLEVREGESINSRPTYHLWGNVLSSRLVDAIYHVDNTIESFIDKEGFIPYKYLLHMLESKQIKETRVVFDHLGKRAFFWSKRISKRWGDEEQDRIDEMAPRSQDMYSGFYYIRTLNFELGRKQSFHVYENKQNLIVELLPVAKETVGTRVGVFPCWKLLLTVKLNNVLKPTGDIFLWVSDDAKRYFVKFDAKVKIGSVYGSLIELKARR